MTEALKNYTHQSHQALEGFLIPVIKNTFTVLEYIRLLKMFYGYYKPVEAAIDIFPISDDLPDYNQRRKAHLILNDIDSLGGDPDIIQGATVPVLSNIYQAYGALYVLEGSTLGGQVITRILQRNLKLPAGNGFTFFSGYGAETGSKWEIFLQALGRHCKNTESFDQMSEAANQTFIQLQNWAEAIYRYDSVK